MKHLLQNTFFLFLLIGCQTSQPKEEFEPLVIDFDFKYVLYIYYNSDDGG